MNRRFLLATGLLAGTIIGAGIFSLPYVFARVGAVTGSLFLVAFTLVYLCIHRMYADLALTRDGRHQFISLAKSYLPRPLAGVASFSILAELFFVLAVYLVLVPSFAGLVFPGGAGVALPLFWLVGSLFIFVRLDLMGWVEFLDVVGILSIVLALFFAGGGRITIPAFQPLDFAAFFLPFGPLLFSLSGRPAVPEVVAEHRRAVAEGRPFRLGAAIAWGTVLPAALYLGFVLVILRLSPTVTPDALSGLTTLPGWLLAALGVVGVLTLWTSYFVIGLNVKDIMRYDLKFPRLLAAALVILAPLALYLIGFQRFLEAVSFTGGVFLALEGVFVIAMWRRAFPDHRLHAASALLYLVFAAALGYELVSFLV